MTADGRGVVVLSGASVVRPDRVESPATLVLENGRIVDIVSGPRGVGDGERRIDLDGHTIVPGFVDVHVHGALGVDSLDGPGAIAALARQLPKWGVTAFCPTTVACTPAALDAMLAEVAALRAAPVPLGARVLPAHLESNFINRDLRGAQPDTCLRHPADLRATRGADADRPQSAEAFSAHDVMAVLDRHRADVGIFTMAPELDGAGELMRAMIAAGVRVSIGHSAASFDQAEQAIAAGVRHATHLFNRMSPMTSREPGVVGAVLAAEDVLAEIICDGYHVHPATIHVAVEAKGPSGVMAITDGTAGSGLPRGSQARLGGRTITVGNAAQLEDGTMAGSVSTMDQIFCCLLNRCDADLVQAATMCATTPARALGLIGHGLIAPGMVADLVVLNSRLEVVQTWIGGELAWKATSR